MFFIFMRINDDDDNEGDKPNDRGFRQPILNANDIIIIVEYRLKIA